MVTFTLVIALLTLLPRHTIRFRFEWSAAPAPSLASESITICQSGTIFSFAVDIAILGIISIVSIEGAIGQQQPRAIPTTIQSAAANTTCTINRNHT